MQELALEAALAEVEPPPRLLEEVGVDRKTQERY